MASLNKVFLLGNLTRDPELRYIPGSNRPVCETGLAVNRSYTRSDGERGEETCFVDLVFWGKQAELANQYLKKGSQALVEGRLHYDAWESQDGQKRSRLRVVVQNVQFLGRPRGGDFEDAPARPGGGTRVVPEPPAGESPAADSPSQEDDIPF